MLIQKKYWVVSILYLFLLLGSSAFAIESTVMTQRPMLSSAWAYALDQESKGWFAYYAHSDNALYVRRPDGSEVALGAKDRERYESGLEITATDQKDIAVLWRDKLPEKALYFLPGLGSRESIPQPSIVGSQESEPLTRMQIGHRDGVSYFLWLGEKGQWGSEGAQGKDREINKNHPTETYHIYFRYTEDSGKTFSNVEQVLGGIYPTWIVDKEVIPVFSRTYFGEQLAMVMRIFDRTSKKFGPPVKIADASTIEPVLKAFEVGGRWFLLWISLDGQPKDALLQGVISDDKGQTWKHFAFESLRGLSMSRLDATGDSKGHILISVSGSREFIEDNALRKKHDIYVIRSADYGVTWSEPLRPRSADLRQFQARYPAAVFGTKPGSVMLVWEDWREIRSNVYVQFSNDYGATWGEAAPLDQLPEIGYGLDYQNRTAWAVGEDRYQVLAKRYSDYTFKASDMIRYEFATAEIQKKALANVKQSSSVNPSSEAHLRERVDQYWKAMEDQDWATSYAINDPFFRGNITYDSYRSNRGLIQHLSHEVLGINRLSDNIAQVRLKFIAEVREIMVHGKPFSKPPKSHEITETWLFVDKKWHREYHDQMKDLRFTRY